MSGPGDTSAAELLAGGDPPHRGRPAAVRRPLTSFVGRDEDVARVLKMLDEGRLVTLTGPGGAGKTRLALETAALLSRETAMHGQDDGPRRAWARGQVWFVELTPVTDPGDVPSAVMHALGIRESPVIAHAGAGQLGSFAAPVQRLVAALTERQDLLILDNCEHVVAAAAALADQVLAGCPEVRVLVTSREPLRIPGESLWQVPPLPVPPTAVPSAPGPPVGGQAPGGQAPDGTGPGSGSGPVGEGGSRVAGYAAVRLLADRAAAVRPEFMVTDANAGDVARICRALDGMPLAIELAAARLRTLSAAQLAERLDARFELLTGGSRTVPRHETLRAVVDWTWELLSGPEQVLARRLAVFPAGATLTAAEQVCQDGALPADAVLPAIFGLVEKSFLTVAEDDEPRYRMLETIRAYCAERLAEAGEEAAVRPRVRGVFPAAGRDRRPDAAQRRAADLDTPADGGAGQHARRAALGDRPPRRDAGGTVRPGTELVLAAARAAARERRPGQGDPEGQRSRRRCRARHRHGVRPGRLRADRGQRLLGCRLRLPAARGRGIPDHHRGQRG